MNADRNSGSTSPLTWVGSFPVYASTVLAAVHAATMVLTAVALAAGAKTFVLSTFGFSSHAVLDDFAFWQFATYAFVHPPELLFLLEVYLLVVFGREIEGFLGRNAFLKLYAALLLLPPLVLLLVGLAGFPSIYMGSSALHFGVFIAFATLYPTAQIFFSIQARWIALALFAVSALQYLAYSMHASLLVLLLDSAAAFVAVQLLRGSWSFELRVPRKRPHLRVVEQEMAGERGVSLTTIDSILEKISKSGMGSLTPKERAQLEKARAALIEKDRTH